MPTELDNAKSNGTDTEFLSSNYGIDEHPIAQWNENDTKCQNDTITKAIEVIRIFPVNSLVY